MMKENYSFEFVLPFDEDACTLTRPLVFITDKITESMKLSMRIKGVRQNEYLQFEYKLKNTGKNCDSFDYKIQLRHKILNNRTQEPQFILFEDAHNICDARNFDFIKRESELFPVHRLLELIRDEDFNRLILNIEITTKPLFSLTQNDLKSDISDMYYRDESSKDVTFQFEDDFVKAHSFIIRARSEPLKKTIEYDLRDKEQKLIPVEDTTPAAFKAFIKYLYTESIDDIEELCEDLIILADRYLVEKLKNECEHHLAKGMNGDNFLKYLVNADKYHCEYLKSSALNFIVANQNLVHTTDLTEFLKGDGMLYQEIIRTLTKSDN